MDVWGRNIFRANMVFSSDFLLKIEEVRKYKSRIELEGRRIQSGTKRAPQTIRQKT